MGCVQITEVRTRAWNSGEVVKRPKTDRSCRTIALPDLVISALREAPRLDRRVCVTPKGVPYTLEAIRRGINRLSQLINKERAKTGNVSPMPVINFRDLRHAYAAFLIRLDVHPKIISERLGHTSIKVTMDTYGYLMIGMQYAAVEAINKTVAQVAIQENKPEAASQASLETVETKSA